MIKKEQVIELLKDEMWFPKYFNEIDWEVSKKLNAILADIISKIVKL
jgi:hypothetical protein